jgi:hypothetical protein
MVSTKIFTNEYNGGLMSIDPPNNTKRWFSKYEINVRTEDENELTNVIVSYKDYARVGLNILNKPIFENYTCAGINNDDKIYIQLINKNGI